MEQITDVLILTRVIGDLEKNGKVYVSGLAGGFFSKKHSFGMGSSSPSCQLCFHYIAASDSLYEPQTYER